MYLIDGHNLIPKIRGLSLKQNDDELALIEVLQNYKRLSGKRMEVYFDGAPPDQAGSRKIGGIQTHFIQIGSTADDAIIRRLRNRKTNAGNITVVTSDQRIIREAQRSHAQVLTAVQFAQQIENTLKKSPGGGKPDPAHLSNEDINDWLTLFNGKKPK